MVKPFVGIPVILLHAVTINLTLEATGGDLGSIVSQYRRRIRRCLNDMTDGAIVRGKFDMVLKNSDGLEFQIPDGDLPVELQGVQPQHGRYGMLHIHFALFDPWHHRDQIHKILKRHFSGNKRICVRRVYEDIIRPNGAVTHGLQGYLEYTSLEKVEINFGGESVDAVIEFALLDNTLGRRKRGFRFGKMPSQLQIRYLDKPVMDLRIASN